LTELLGQDLARKVVEYKGQITELRESLAVKEKER